jgi:nitrate reductase NapD
MRLCFSPFIEYSPSQGEHLNLSGIVVAVSPGKLDECVTALSAFHNVEVHQTDLTTNQIVVVQEAENVNQEIDSLKRIKALPMVTYAEMVYHYLAEDNNPGSMLLEGIDSSNLDETLKKLNS